VDTFRDYLVFGLFFKFLGAVIFPFQPVFKINGAAAADALLVLFYFASGISAGAKKQFVPFTAIFGVDQTLAANALFKIFLIVFRLHILILIIIFNPSL